MMNGRLKDMPSLLSLQPFWSSLAPELLELYPYKRKNEKCINKGQREKIE